MSSVNHVDETVNSKCKGCQIKTTSCDRLQREVEKESGGEKPELVREDNVLAEILKTRKKVREIRNEQAKRLPGGIFQDYLTWLSCIPYEGQVPSWHRNPWDLLLEGLSKLVAGLWLSGIGMLNGGLAWMLVPLGWILTVGGARYLQVGILHQCVHGRFSKNQYLDRRLGQMLSSLILVQDFDGYHEDHVENHHKKSVFASINDPDMAFLYQLGFKPGMSIRDLRKTLLINLVSPRFHYLFFRARLKANFVNPHSEIRRIFPAVIFLPIVVGTVYSHSWSYLFFVCLFPLVFLYQSSSLLQFVSEHSWERVQGDKESTLQHYARKSHGRILICPVPDNHMSPLFRSVVWVHWGLVTCFYTIVRTCILVFDLGVHDYHHLFPTEKNWADAIYLRESVIQSSSHKSELFQETVGLINAIDLCLSSISSSPALAFSVTPEAESYLAM